VQGARINRRKPLTKKSTGVKSSETSLKKVELLERIDSIATTLDKKSLIHLADSLMDCMDAIAQEKIKERDVLIRVSKIATFLDKRGESVLAERLDELLPDIIGFKRVGTSRLQKRRKYMVADQAYSLVKKFKHQYAVGLIDVASFEYNKMKELESMLKAGFLMPAPNSYKSFPTDSKNWWDHFSKKG
jgi:hypothetical protein